MTKEDIDASEAPLLDHLLELRTRLIYCVAGFFLTFIVSFFFSSDILGLLILPFKWGTGTDVGLISIKLLGVFLVKLKIAMFGEGGGWECVGEGCDAAGGAEPAPGADSPPATARYIPLPGVRLPGNDLYVLELAAPNWMLCRQACTDDENCGAWTYRAPNAGSGPLCLIKSRAGLPIPDACCRSGIRQ